MGLIVSHFCCILDIPAFGIVTSEKICFHVVFFSYYKPITDPRGMVGRIYKGNYYPLLYTKYKSPGLCDFREEDFLWFSYCKSMRANDPWCFVIFDPGA